MSLTSHLRRDEIRHLTGDRLTNLFSGRFGSDALADPVRVLPDAVVRRPMLNTRMPDGTESLAPWYIVTFNVSDPIRCNAKSQDLHEAAMRAALLAVFDGPEDLLEAVVHPSQADLRRLNREKQAATPESR